MKLQNLQKKKYKQQKKIARKATAEHVALGGKGERVEDTLSGCLKEEDV